MSVGIVHVFDYADDSGSGIELSLVTATGAIKVLLPDRLASDMADGIARLPRHR